MWGALSRLYLIRPNRYFEVNLVDDGSTDNTAEVVSSFNDKRVKYIRHQVNKGTPAAARNTCVRAARGELIGFVDYDDEWLPERIWGSVPKVVDDIIRMIKN